MKIRIPGHGPVTIYSDTNTFVDIPSDESVEVVEAPGGVGGTSYVLREDGSYLLREDGFKILREN